MATSVPNAVEFTNNIGQTIQPGDEVVIVTSSHSVSTNKGVYVGIHSGGGVSCVKKVKTSYYVYKADGIEVHYSFFEQMNKQLNAWAKEWRANNPGKYAHYLEPEYKAIREEYMSKVETKYKFVDRRTTLQRNRIYKIAA